MYLLVCTSAQIYGTIHPVTVRLESGRRLINIPSSTSLTKTKGNKLTESTSASLNPDQNTTVQAVQNAEAEKPKDLVFQDDLHRLQYESFQALIKEKNSLVGRANAAKGDRESLTAEIRDNSTDPEIVNLREQISELIFKLDGLVKPQVDAAISAASGDVNEIEEQIKAKDKTLKSGLTYFFSVYGDEWKDHFTKQDRLKGVTLRSGGGGRRIRGYNLTVTVDGEDKTFENFSTAAKYIDVETIDLQRAFMDEAGTEDADKFPPVVSFNVNYVDTDKDGNKTEKSAHVRAFKSETEATGPSDDSDNEPEDEDATEVESDSTESDEIDLENV